MATTSNKNNTLVAMVTCNMLIVTEDIAHYVLIIAQLQVDKDIMRPK